MDIISRHVANKIKHFRNLRNMTQDDLAEKLNVSPQTVSRYENGERKANHDILFELSKALKVSISDFFPPIEDGDFEVEDSKLIKIPVLGYIKAGLPIEAQEDIIDHIAIPEDWTKGDKNFYALKISGDSMKPKYEEGDIVIFEQTNDFLHAKNRDCAVMVNHTECVFKKLFIGDDGITLQSYNPDYKTMVFSKNDVASKPVTIIGVAVEKRVKV